MSFCTDWYWYDVASSLADAGIDLAYLISRPPAVQAKAREELKNTVVIDQDQFERASLIFNLNTDNPTVLDADMLEKLKDAEYEFLQITDRLAFFQLTVGRRREIFKELVKYWYYFLQLHKLDAIFFTDTPHVGFDTVLFAVAKTFFDIPIISIRRPFIRDRMLVVSDYHRYLPRVPLSYLAKAKKKQLTTLVGNELISDVFSENSWQKKDRTISQAIHKPTGVIPTSGKKAFEMLNPVLIYQYVRSLFERSRYGGFNYNSDQIQLVEKICGYYHRFFLGKQRKLYDQLANSFPTTLPSSYLYFPLHLQPERSTIPEGGVFEDQFLALEILQKTVPKDWVIVVKEHPRQFHIFDFQKHHFRSEEYYTKLSSFTKVMLCPMHIPQEKLVQHAQVTATITGTGGWESLLIGKPAIIFGNTWYSGCQSAYRISSIASARRAFRLIAKKNKEQVELDVLRFLAYYRDALVIASNAREFASQSHREYKTLVKNIVVAVKKEILKQI